MNYPLKFKKGFTLVETMVAISILMLGILGPLSIASSGLRNSLFAKDQVTAYYLAQEGIEYVRYVRDDNYLLERSNWLSGLNDCIGAFGCAIDTGEWFGSNTSVTYQCLSTDCTNHDDLYKDSSTEYYTHQASGNTASPFSRIVIVEEILDEKEAKITSTVTWQSGVGQKSITLTESVFNIYKTL